MPKQNCIDTLNYIIKQGWETITSSTNETEPKVDFVNIFSRSDSEFESFYDFLQSHSKPMKTYRGDRSYVLL